MVAAVVGNVIGHVVPRLVDSHGVALPYDDVLRLVDSHGAAPRFHLPLTQMRCPMQPHRYPAAVQVPTLSCRKDIVPLENLFGSIFGSI